MKLHQSLNFFSLVILGCLSACNPQGHQAPLSIRSGNLIGGSVADPKDYPATIRLISGCTAAKVAPKLILTAAHCVVDLHTGDIRANYQTDSKIGIQYGSKTYTDFVVETLPHESFVNAVKAANAAGNSPNNVSKDSYDVAFIVVRENLTDIGEAEIDLNKVLVTDPLIVGGYGCEDHLGGTTPSPRHYKAGETYAVDIDALAGARGNYSSRSVQQSIFQHNILTAAQKFDSAVPSICPGDSGGPVYRANDHLAIVGVNSYYSFNDESGISTTNWHTRLSNLKTWVLDIVDARGE